MGAEVTVVRETPAVPTTATEAEVMETSEEKIMRTITQQREGETRRPILSRGMSLGKSEKCDQLILIRQTRGTMMVI